MEQALNHLAQSPVSGTVSAVQVIILVQCSKLHVVVVKQGIAYNIIGYDV